LIESATDRSAESIFKFSTCNASLDFVHHLAARFRRPLGFLASTWITVV